MATLAQIRDEVLSKISDGQVTNPTSVQVEAQINSSIDYFSTKSFWFNETTATLTATIGNKVLSSIPVDFKQIIEPNGLVLLTGSVKYPLKHITPLQFDMMDVQGTGISRFYTYRNGEFWLYLYPDQAYTMYLFYRKKYADLTANNSNDFTNYCSRLIMYKTLADCLRDYRSDYERAAVYDQKVQDELMEIKQETNNRVVTGNLVTENISNTNYYFN